MVSKLFEQTDWCEIAGTVYAQQAFGGKNIFMVHYHNIHEVIARSWDFDVVLYGHNHRRNEMRVWDTLIVNPWAIAWNKETPSYAIYDTSTDLVEFVELIS